MVGSLGATSKTASSLRCMKIGFLVGESTPHHLLKD
jgi:hypothetical protein